MTGLEKLLNNRGPAGIYEDCWIPCTLWPFAADLDVSAGFTTLSLQKSVRNARFDSVEHLLNVHLTGGMRVVDDEVRMGMFDLSDRSFEPKVDGLLQFLEDSLGKYQTPSGLEVPWSSDVLIASA